MLCYEYMSCKIVMTIPGILEREYFNMYQVGCVCYRFLCGWRQRHSEGAIVPCTISADMSLREVTAKLVKVQTLSVTLQNVHLETHIVLHAKTCLLAKTE